jgi:hypothetical protein
MAFAMCQSLFWASGEEQQTKSPDLTSVIFESKETDDNYRNKLFKAGRIKRNNTNNTKKDNNDCERLFIDH